MSVPLSRKPTARRLLVLAGHPHVPWPGVRLAMVLWPGCSPDQAAIAEHAWKGVGGASGQHQQQPDGGSQTTSCESKRPWTETEGSCGGASFVSIGLAVSTDASPLGASTELQI